MLKWSNGVLKLTFGVGGLAMTAVLSTIYDKITLPFWLLFILTFLPFMIFVFVKPGEQLPDKTVSFSHLSGVIWYVLCFFACIFLSYNKLPVKEFVLYTVLMLVGLIPCLVVMKKYLAGEYDNTI